MICPWRGERRACRFNHGQDVALCQINFILQKSMLPNNSDLFSCHHLTWHLCCSHDLKHLTTLCHMLCEFPPRVLKSRCGFLLSHKHSPCTFQSWFWGMLKYFWNTAGSYFQYNPTCESIHNVYVLFWLSEFLLHFGRTEPELVLSPGKRNAKERNMTFGAVTKEP